MLTSAEAAERLKRFGPNRIQAASKRSALNVFVSQFKSPLVAILIVACLLSAFLGDFVEAVAIGAILIVNALIGFFQEYRAEAAVEALIDMTAPRARVLRDGTQKEVPATDIVQGDWLLLEAGDVVAADGKVLEAARLQINEAVLTGESLPVYKSAGTEDNLVFMGTSVVNGTARVEVSTTGMRTELGKIAHLITTAEESATPLQVQLVHVGKMLLILCGVVVGLMTIVALLQGQEPRELLIYALSLAVATVPEGMPAIVTVALAVGVQRMATRNALIRHLPAVETLGSVSVICTDKTGTLTTGQMRVRELWGANRNELLKAAASCCDAELGEDRSADLGDPMEVAILIEARQQSIEKSEIEAANPRIANEPFDSDRKMMSVTRANGITYIKGAPEVVLARSNPSKLTDDAQAVLKEMSDRGLRVLAIAEARADTDDAYNFLGMIAVADPPRSEVIKAISEAKRAGILPVMITGDHPNTARAIAIELGLITQGDEVHGRIHARATPEDKLKIVRDWKSRGAIVAMTGDGVNDAPALREAHIGIAMGRTGTQVTRQSADMILADDNFATIIAAIREGRTVYWNIRKAIVYLLTGNFAELMTVLAASIFGLPVPFLALHLLWINLVTDALPALTLIADPSSERIMSAKPRPSSERILGRPQWLQIVLVGTLEAISIAVLYWIHLRTSTVEYARNISFTALVASQLFRALSARSGSEIFWKTGVLSNLWLITVIVFTFILQISLHFIPLTQKVFGLSPIGMHEVIWILPFALVTVTAVELTKLIKKATHRVA